MRFALVATPLAMPDMRPAPGSLDGDVIRSRLPLDDTGFRVVDLDPSVDLAEQLDLLFERGDIPRDAAVLFYASAAVILSVEGEIFLSLDPGNPDTGDSIADLASLMRERSSGPLAFVLECRHAPDPEDPFRSATVVAAAKSAVAPARTGIELLVAAQPHRGDDAEDRASPLTSALLAALDGDGAANGLTLADFYEAARESPQIVGAVPCFAHARGQSSLELVPRRAGEARDEESARDEAGTHDEAEARDEEDTRDEAVAREEEADARDEADGEEPITQEAATDEMDPMADAEMAEIVAAERRRREAARAAAAAAAAETPARPPFRSEAASIPIEVDAEPEEAPAAAPPPPPAPSPPPPPVSPASAKPASEAPPPTSAKPASEAPPPRSAKPISEAPAPVSAGAPASAPPPEPAKPATPPPVPKPKPKTAADHMADGDKHKAAGEHDAALAAYKRALAMLGASATTERAEIYLRQGQVKQALGVRREAIAAFEKTISMLPISDGVVPPAHLAALEALLELNVAEGDWRAVAAAEERVLATLREPQQRFDHLMAFGARWMDEANDPVRARSAFERAREISPDDTGCLERLGVLYDKSGAQAEAFAIKRRVAELTRDPRTRAERFFILARYCVMELRREELGLELLDKALESDPTMLEPMAVIARILGDRQEWSELEQAYRRMLNRVDHLPSGPVRDGVTWELCRRLGFMFRDHLDDPALALDAFEDAVHAKPADLGTRLTAAEIARSLGKNDRASVHLEAAAALDPARVETYHDLFEAFQKLRRPDQAYNAACVTMFLRQADARERFIFEEHKPHGVPKPTYSLRGEAWEWLRPHDRDTRAEAVLAAITPAAIALKLATLANEGRLPAIDPAGRQDPEKSTVSIVRSFTWASHFLSVPAPAVYLSDDRDLALASVIAEEPTVFAGNKVLRGRSLPELAFYVGRHLTYHVGSHRLLLYYPSIEELTACFLAAVRIVLPEVPAPPSMRSQVLEIERGVALRLSESHRVDLAAAVAAFESGGSRAHLAEWVAAIERCATRAGYLLAGDLEVAAGVLKSEPRGVLDADAKMADLLAFAVSDEHRALREGLGIAIQP